MAAVRRPKIYSYLIEIGKWGLVLWLIFPIREAVDTSVDFARVALGVVLFVIFAGKLLYDVVLFPRQHAVESSPGKDILSMVGIVLGIALLVCLLIFFVGLYVVEYMSSNSNLPN